ncbi:MAG: hypothetical protein HY889_07685 [Deltaproteobacteria bacterium]|nr:hypothetical protein [Deltaproteobacteria bacterium]
MKKNFLSFFLVIGLFLSYAGSVFACDFCLLSQGISPLETLNGAGVRVNERYTSLDKVYNGTHKISNPGAKEEFWTTELTGFYAVTEDLMVLGVVPLKKTRMKGELMVNPDGTVDLDPMKGRESGLGDVALIGRYSFFKKHTLDTTTTIAGLLGVKFATGKTDGKADNGEYLDSHIQLGTGSTDYIIGVSLSHSVQKISLSANLLGTLTTEGEFGNKKHRFGNAVNYDVTAKYRVYPADLGSRGPQFFIALGVNGELREREKTDGVKDPNSGGNTTYLSPGIQAVVAPHWVFELSYQQAIYHNLYGIQLGENHKATGGVTYLF